MTASQRTIPVQAVWRAARRAAAMEITNPGIDGGLVLGGWRWSPAPAMG